jgi:5'-nucleotidase
MPQENERPLILVTNDDGIGSSALDLLVKHLETLGEVIVVAPDREQSAVGHGISLSRPLRIKTLEKGHRYAVSGTPADAVLLGLFSICPRQPTLVISGINFGLNLGTDVLYSGTVAGALEGTIHHLSAMAISQEIPDDRSQLSALLDRTATFGTLMAKMIIAHGVPKGTALNINAPATQTHRFCWTRLGRRVYREQVLRREDLRGRSYYWVGGAVVKHQSEPGTDSHAVESDMISMTPLSIDMTADLPSCYDEWKVEGFQRARISHSVTP